MDPLFFVFAIGYFLVGFLLASVVGAVFDENPKKRLLMLLTLFFWPGALVSMSFWGIFSMFYDEWKENWKEEP